MPLAFAWLWFGGLGILYLILLITAGVLTLRNRHIVLFIIGIVFPILWIIGAVMSPRSRY
jgi:hypothetical protein